MQLTRAELFSQIWREPMGKVAARYGLTGNGLAKICDRLNIPRPSRAHWMRNEDARDERPDLPPPPVGLSEAVALGARQPRQSPGTRRRMDSGSRRDQILDASAAIALEEGLSAVNVRRIASELGISETQVNNCVGGRTELLISLARREVVQQERSRRTRVSRSSDRHTRIVLSTIGYLHEAAKRGPLLQMLLRVPEVKVALRAERQSATETARAPIVQRLTKTGEMDVETARASTAALTAVSLKAGGIVAAGRAPLGVVEQLCLAVIMAGVASDDRIASGG
ncbi:TetR/AcrR family transcriptional regulator [Erythrobacter mangrovi]|uniref:TetR/AcrR family transcriptional regulator n=1 Tax=Erythrobacter mangrovi TaxID=2739433 RepID=A0A7D3XD33_9SPHN|nr:TetR/AcrR family transcriptional regulator [Erythrobacter mangrovi]QKG72200.1 TetR/AcrR family transcriptional regulator [Erythrobacter mangrovi]